MQNNSGGEARAAWARGYISLWALMALVAPLSAQPTEAAPFAYLVNETSDTVSVIDTAANKVVTTVALPVGSFSLGVAVTPDGKHAYVTNSNFGSNPGTVTVIDTATNKVVTTIALPVGSFPSGVDVSPDGEHAYVANTGSGTVSVISTASNMVVATVTVGISPHFVAVTPDGIHAYVTN